jgi:protocatechuate 3,4-dioxygenase beta subunit
MRRRPDNGTAGTSGTPARRLPLVMAFAVLVLALVPTPAGANTDSPPQGTITGTVTDAHGAPVAGVEVSAECRSCWFGTSGYNPPGGHGHDTTDAHGHYAMTVDAYVYQVRFWANSAHDLVEQYYPDTTDPDDYGPVDVVGGKTTAGIDARMPIGGKVSGTVTPATPSSGPTTVALTDRYGRELEYATADRDGHYELAPMPPGAYLVSFRPFGDGAPQFARDAPTLAQADPVTVRAGATTTGVDARIRPAGSLSGTVTDADGHPLARADVVVRRVDEADYAYDSRKLETDGAGRFSADGLAEDTYVADARHDGDGGTSAPVAVYSGADTPNVDVVLGPPGQIIGTVRDEHGDGVSATVAYLRIGGNARPPETFDEYLADSGGFGGEATGSNGAYALTGLLPGRYVLVAQSDAGFLPRLFGDPTASTSARAITVASGQHVLGVDTTLQAKPPGGISGMVTDRRGSRHGGVRIEAFGVDGTAAGHAFTVQVPFYAPPDGALPPGGYALALSPGTYRIAATFGDGSTVWYPAAATRAASTPVTVGTTVRPLDFSLGPKPSSPPPPPPVARPVAVRAVSRADRHGRIVLSLHCPGPLTCRGRIVLTATDAGRTRTIGRTTYTVGPTRTDRRGLHLNATGRRLLRRHTGGLTAAYAVRPTGTTASAAGSVTLRRPLSVLAVPRGATAGETTEVRVGTR